MSGLPPGTVLGQGRVGVGLDLGTQVGLLLRWDRTGATGARLVGERAPLAPPLPPAPLRATGDAEGPFDFSRYQPGVLGRQQPRTEIERLLAGHASSLLSADQFRKLR